MKGIVCLQVYKRILEATLLSTVAGKERGTLGLSKCSQLCQAYGRNFTKTSGRFVQTELVTEAEIEVGGSKLYCVGLYKISPALEHDVKSTADSVCRHHVNWTDVNFCER